MNQLEWQELTFVVLEIDAGNWLEVSGSLKPEDGLSARCAIAGDEYVVARPPQHLDELVQLLQSFCARDGRWRTMVDWS